MELFASNGNSRKMQRASSEGLKTNEQYLHVAVVSLSVLLTISFNSNIIYKNEDWYHCQFHLSGFY